MPPIASSFLAGTSYLEVNGQAFPLVSCLPPDIVWDVIETPSGPRTRRLGPPHAGTLTIRFSPPSMPPLLKWVEELAGEQMNQHDLVVLQTDQDGKVRDSLQLKGCVLIGLRFPACSATGKDAYLVEAVFMPERMAAGPVGGIVRSAAPGRVKKWVSSNFAVSVPGLPSARINQVGPIGISRKLSNEGIDRHGRLEMPGALDYQPLELTVVGPDCTVWRNAALDRVARGPHDDSAEITLELRDTSLKNVLATFIIGVIGMSRFKSVASGGTEGLPAVGACFELSSLRLKLN